MCGGAKKEEVVVHMEWEVAMGGQPGRVQYN